MTLRLLHEDARLLVVDKAAGERVIPGREGGPSLCGELSAQRGEKLFVVHRLDAGTSGVLLFARDAGAHRFLSLAFEGREVEKRYLALVVGLPPVDEATVSVALHGARKGKSRPAFPGEPDAKAAVTELRVLARFEGHALVEARPHTGRHHQIRVHLKYWGFPLAVDPAYGAAGPLVLPGATLGRTPLHAASLELPHPDGGRRRFEAPLPEDLVAALRALGSGP